MARGWESKQIEDQQAEASRSQAKPNRPLTSAQAAQFRERENLLLSRKRVLRQMETTVNPRHRELLQLELDALDRQLHDLSQ
jgi:hypothetical protein